MSASVFPDESLRSSMTRTSAQLLPCSPGSSRPIRRLRLSRADSAFLPHQLPISHVIELAEEEAVAALDHEHNEACDGRHACRGRHLFAERSSSTSPRCVRDGASFYFAALPLPPLATATSIRPSRYSIQTTRMTPQRADEPTEPAAADRPYIIAGVVGAKRSRC